MVILCALLWLVALPGCTSSNNLRDDVAILRTSEDGLTPAAAALLREAKRHAQYRVTVTVLGTGLGAAVGGISGQKWIYLVPGAVIGAEAGYAFGNYIEARESRQNMDAQKVSLLVAAARKDAATYDALLNTADAAIREAADAVARARSSGSAEYAGAARNISAISGSLRGTIHELAANERIMLLDVEEAAVAREMGHPQVHPDLLAVQVRDFEAQRERMRQQHRRVAALAEGLPDRERPLLEPTPD